MGSHKIRSRSFSPGVVTSNVAVFAYKQRRKNLPEPTVLARFPSRAFRHVSEVSILLPFFSIVLPTYNRARLLDRALASVSAQSHAEWELLITDDGSTDGSWTTLCDWIRRDRRIRCWRHNNRGQAESRNEMLHHARAPWVVFLDSDDEFLPDHLALRYQAITAEPAVELWVSPMRIVGSPFVPCRLHPGELIHIDRCIGAGMLTVRREALLKVGGFPNVRYAEESGLMSRLLAAGIRHQPLLHRSYVYHRGHSDTITRNQESKSALPATV